MGEIEIFFPPLSEDEKSKLVDIVETGAKKAKLPKSWIVQIIISDLHYNIKSDHEFYGGLELRRNAREESLKTLKAAMHAEANGHSEQLGYELYCSRNGVPEYPQNAINHVFRKRQLEYLAKRYGVALRDNDLENWAMIGLALADIVSNEQAKPKARRGRKSKSFLSNIDYIRAAWIESVIDCSNVVLSQTAFGSLFAPPTATDIFLTLIDYLEHPEDLTVEIQLDLKKINKAKKITGRSLDSLLVSVSKGNTIISKIPREL